MADYADSLAVEIIREQKFDLDAVDPDERQKIVSWVRDVALEHVEIQVEGRLTRRDRKRLGRLLEWREEELEGKRFRELEGTKTRMSAGSDWSAIEPFLADSAPGFDARAAFHAGAVHALLTYKHGHPAKPRLGRIATFDGTSPLLDCALSSDGALVAAAGDDGDVTVWDAATSEARATLHGHVGSVFACEFSPDGSVVASGSADRTAKLWEISTGLATTLVGHEEAVVSCAFSPDGSVLATTDVSSIVKLWDPATSKENATLRGHAGAVDACAFSPDGRRLLTGSRDNTLKLWDVDSCVEVRTLAGHEEDVTDCAFAPDGSYAVSASRDETLRIWDVATGETRRSLSGHRAPVLACVVTSDGSLIVSTGQDGSLRLWDIHREIPSLCPLFPIPGHLQPATGCAAAPAKSEVLKRSARTKQQVTLITPTPVRDRHWSGTHGVVATAGVDETVQLWAPAGMLEFLVYESGGEFKQAESGESG